MTDTIQEVFNEYTRLRLNGLEATEAVRALHPHVGKLNAEMRDELASILRAWENHRTENITFSDREKLKEVATKHNKKDSISCSECGKINSANDEICFSCGALLNNVKMGVTNKLKAKTDELRGIDDAHFGENGVLILTPEDYDEMEPFVLRPQMESGGLTFGRSVNDNRYDDVDVDLEPFGATNQGVSRVHANIIYDELSETLALFDMGSTNGSYINGQKLQPNERRALRHGDEIRFGRLKFRVVYQSGTK